MGSKIFALIALLVSSVLTGTIVPAFSQGNVSTAAGGTNITSSMNGWPGRLIPNIPDTYNGTSVSPVPHLPPVVLSPETVPQINETVIVLNPQAPTTNATTINTTNFNFSNFNTTTLDPNTRTRALLIYFDSVRVLESHDIFGAALWYLWAGIRIIPLEQERLWVPLLREVWVWGGGTASSFNTLWHPKAIAVEVPEFPAPPLAIDLKTQGVDDDCYKQWTFPFEFCSWFGGVTPSVPSHDDWEGLGEVSWLGWNYQNWGMDPGSTSGRHTVPSVEEGPFGIKYADYEITFYVMDCGGPTCTVIDFDGNVHVLEPPAVLY